MVAEDPETVPEVGLRRHVRKGAILHIAADHIAKLTFAGQARNEEIVLGAH